MNEIPQFDLAGAPKSSHDDMVVDLALLSKCYNVNGAPNSIQLYYLIMNKAMNIDRA